MLPVQLFDMPPFTAFPLVSGIKDKVDAVLTVGETVYVACTGGIVHVYELQYPQDSEWLCLHRVLQWD